MENKKLKFTTIDEYVQSFPKNVQEILATLRKTIEQAAPTAKEKISYQMPTYDLYGNLVHFAAYEKHIGFYPTPSGIEKFKVEISKYKHAIGSVQFPIDKPLPYDLIERIVKFRVAENIQLAEEKAAAKHSAKALTKSQK